MPRHLASAAWLPKSLIASAFVMLSSILDVKTLSNPDAYSFRLLNVSSLSERVQEALAKREMSQAELARKIGVTRAAVSQWANGQTKAIEGEHLTRAARALRCHPGWLAEDRLPKWLEDTGSVAAVVRLPDRPKDDWPFQAERSLWDAMSKANRDVLDGIVSSFLHRHARKGGVPASAKRKHDPKALG